jgi:thioredoxin reductase (NADPH)
MIAGGGDSAVDWAVSLFDVAKKITVIHRRDKFRAMPDMVEKMKLLARDYPDKIEILSPYQLSQLHGPNGQLQSITLATMDGDTVSRDVDSLLAFYGLVPELGPIADWGLNLNDHTIAINQATAETSVESIYAVGDIASYDHKLKLILTGFAEVASAAHDAYTHVHPDKSLHFQYSTSKGVSKLTSMHPPLHDGGGG